MTKKILIIDDDINILYALGAICEYKKWDHLGATDPIKGVKILKEKPIDMVIIDYHMPNMGGIEGVKKIREINKSIPILVLTIEEDQSVADRFIEAGANDFALKPIKAPDIISRINLNLQIANKIREVENNETIEEYKKGISKETRDIIINYLKLTDSYCNINNISKNTGLAYQTVHRYLQYLENENKVEVYYKYGKVGRPQKKYKYKN